MANAIVSSKTVLAQKKRKVFLRILAQTGKVADAARACGFQDTTTLTKYRKQDEDFAAEWELALESAAAVLEAEATRRAVDGVREPVFYKGEIVGYKLNYSDALIMFLLRGIKPDTYRESARGGDMNINFGIAVLPMTAQSDEAWEQRAVNMHDSQKVIELEEKPTENNMVRVQRGD